MPLLSALAARFSAERPFDGLTIAACLHVTAETAVLVRTLRAGGASVRLAASNPLSTQDDIAAALTARDGVEVFAKAGVDRDAYYEHIELALGADEAVGPDLVIDDGGDLVSTLHTRAQLGRAEPGAGRLRGHDDRRCGCAGWRPTARWRLGGRGQRHPVTRLVDNGHGTAQSVIDGLFRASGALAGKTMVVAGFGACGAGIAEFARALGARVVTIEVDPVRALDAVPRGSWCCRWPTSPRWARCSSPRPARPT